jgi:DNA mismatch endonuclease, patch repair protein
MDPFGEEKIVVPRFEEAQGFYTSPAKSRQMARIRGKNTRPELRLRRALHAAGLRFRVAWAKLPGKPDVTVAKYKLAVFVDGEFWHGHHWEQKQAKIKSNRAFWLPKIARNQQRDAEVNAQLAALGYTVLRFWQQEVEKNLGHCLWQILAHVQARQARLPPGAEATADW